MYGSQGGFNRYGAPRGFGQQQRGSQFLDQPEENQEQDPLSQAIRRPQAQARPVGPPARLNPSLDQAVQPTPLDTLYPGKPVQADAQRRSPTMPQGGHWNQNFEWEGAPMPEVGIGNMGRLEGFNTQMWGSGERGTESFKNKFGQLASNFDSDLGVDGLMANETFRQLFPNAVKVPGGKGDLIDFGDGNPVDVIRGAGAAGSAWQFAPSGSTPRPQMQQDPLAMGMGADASDVITAQSMQNLHNAPEDQDIIAQLRKLLAQGNPQLMAALGVGGQELI